MQHDWNHGQTGRNLGFVVWAEQSSQGSRFKINVILCLVNFKTGQLLQYSQDEILRMLVDMIFEILDKVDRWMYSA